MKLLSNVVKGLSQPPTRSPVCHLHKQHCRSIAVLLLTSKAKGRITFWFSLGFGVREFYSRRVSPLSRKAKALRSGPGLQIQP